MGLFCAFVGMLAFLMFSSTSVVYVPTGTSGSGINHPGGLAEGVMRFKGTIGGHEEIHTQMQTMHPSFNPDDITPQPPFGHPPQTTFGYPGSNTTSTNNTGTTISPRYPTDNLNCWPVPGQSWNRATTSNIDSGIRYLRNFVGWCNAGARSCVRISCSYRASIWLCNDQYAETWQSCNCVADYAQGIIAKCNVQWYGAWFVCGQWFDTNYWNVVIRDDSRC